MTERPARYHSIVRTSPKGPGQKFLGTCTLCGTPNLPGTAIFEECENIRGLTPDEALVETVGGAETGCRKGYAS